MMRNSVKLCSLVVLLGLISGGSTSWASSTSPGARLVSTPTGPIFIVLKSGSFERKDGKRVQLPSFAMSEMETTTAQYMTCVNDGGCRTPEWAEAGSDYELQMGINKFYKGFTDDKQPIVGVSWFEAKKYAEWLSKKTGHTYRLPSEAEWEYAARAGTETKWSHGDDDKTLRDYAWYNVNSGAKTQPVGTKKPNSWGLYDMAGNVSEWVMDCYVVDFKGVPTNGQAFGNPSDPSCSRVLRGGAWNTSNPVDLGNISRNDSRTSGNRVYYFGFRLMRVL